MSADALFSNTPEAYGDRFKDHLLEQYKLYVESSQKVSEKRISTGNYLLTVSSSLLTVFGVLSTLHIGGAWLAVIPIAGLAVSTSWFGLVTQYKNLNPAKFKVIHELEKSPPAALFAYEWPCCELGEGKAYKPITHHERWIPVALAVVFIGLAAYVVLAPPPEKTSKIQPVLPISVSGSIGVDVKPGMQQAAPPAIKKRR